MNFWTRVGHMLTGWSTYRPPEADRVTLPRFRTSWTQLDPVDWAGFDDLHITQSPLHRVGVNGVGRGYPIQAAHRNGSRRSVSWEGTRIRVPNVHGDYWLTGDPNPRYDRRAVIAAEDGVYELIQFDPQRGYCWSFRRVGSEGRVVEGRKPTTGHVASVRCWTPWSWLEPHEQALVLPDYVGADGLLESGPPCDGLYVLDRKSDSYAAMMVEGGECAQRAEALAMWGARSVDRSGYSDSSSREVGTKPHSPHLLTQAGRQWGDTNIERFRVRLGDLRLAT